MKPSVLLPAALLMAAWQSAGAQQPVNWPQDASQYRFYMIGNAHIDPVWLWPWTEGLSVVHSTFRSALDRMKENPDFIFTASSAQFFEWVEHNDPAMMGEIQQRVKQGRFCIVGGWWVEPDVNMPSGESMMRQGLYSQLLFKRLFGRMATVAYNPDSFGHAGTLPQILKLQGMQSYVFMRPMPEEKTLPGSLFWWEASDGSRVLTYRIPFSYTATRDLDRRLLQIMTQHLSVSKDLMAFYGVGDHGGGPTKQNLSDILQLMKQPNGPKLVFSSPEKYFAAIRARKDLDLPVVKDDLQFHSVGCYTAESEQKKFNRMTELALQTAEKIASLGSLAWGANYPKDEFTRSWKNVLFLQFHDSMAGTALPQHYVQARSAYGYALDTADRATYLAAQKLAWQIPTEDPESEYIVVFNPHAWPISTPVEYDFSWDPAKESRLEDENGRAISHQWTAASTVAGDRHKLVFVADLPAFGYRQFRLRPADPEATAPAPVHATERTMENDRLRVTFYGSALALYDKSAQRDVFTGASAGHAIVIDDPSDTWSHRITSYTKEVGVFGNASFHVLENGPLRAAVRVRTTYGASSLQTDWYLYAGSSELEARVGLDWHEHQKMLKFSFPVNVAEPQATYEIPYGIITRPTNGNEYPGQRWIDVTGSRDGKSYGLAIANDAKYGYSISGTDMRISVARSAVYALHMPHTVEPGKEYIWQDQGIQTFRMLLMPHAGSWRDIAVPRRTDQFTAPLPVIYQGIHRGTRPKSASFLSLNASDVIVSAIKRSEVGNDLIVRCFETDGKATSATLDLPFAKARWSGQFHPFEIKTLRITVPSGAVREVNGLEQ